MNWFPKVMVRVVRANLTKPHVPVSIKYMCTRPLEFLGIIFPEQEARVVGYSLSYLIFLCLFKKIEHSYKTSFISDF